MNMELLLALQVPGGGGTSFLLMMGLMVGVFYFILILPQQRRQKKWQAMLGALKGDSIHLRVPPDNLRLEVTKASVAQLTTADEEVQTK